MPRISTRQAQGTSTGRGAESRVAIRAAVVKLLGDLGYDRMSMDEIATAAGSSKATIYRHWSDKPELVADTVAQLLRAEDVDPDTGSLRGDLIAAMANACEAVNGPIGALFGGVVTAAQHNPRLKHVLNEMLVHAKAAKYHSIVRRAVARGEIPAGFEPALLHEVIHCMISGRLLWQLGALDAEFIDRAVDQVLLPMAGLGHSGAAAR